MTASSHEEGYRPGQERSDNGPGLILCWCPAGSFRMGSDDVFDELDMAVVAPEVVAASGWSSKKVVEEREGEGVPSEEGEDLDDDDDGGEFDPTAYWGVIADESPVEVTLTRGFWLGKYPVTQAEYEAVMGPGSHVSRFRDRDDSTRRPVETLNWDAAVAFCRELTAAERAAGRLPGGWAYRLPTEAQWEYACRAGTTSRYYSGSTEEDLGRVAFFRTRASRRDPEIRRNEQTHAVGGKEMNAWGLHDMLGNVHEWCRDNYASELPGGKEPFVLTSKDDQRVLRGGGYGSFDYDCRASSRKPWSPDSQLTSTGLRVALVRVGDEPVDERERTTKTTLFTRRKAAVEGRPVPRPPETHDELLARIEAFLAAPEPSGKTPMFYEMSDTFLRLYADGEFAPEQQKLQALLVLAITGTIGDVKRADGDEEDRLLERAALYRGLYRLFYDEEPEDYQHPGEIKDEDGNDPADSWKS